MGVEVCAIKNDEIKHQLLQLEELFKLGFIQQSEYDSRKNELLVDPLTPFLRKEGDLSIVTYSSKDSLVYDNSNYIYGFHSSTNDDTLENIEHTENLQEPVVDVYDDDDTEEATFEEFSEEEEEEYVICGEEERPIDTFTDEQYETSQHKRFGVLSHVYHVEKVQVDRFIKPNRSRFRKRSIKKIQKNDTDTSDCQWIQNCKLTPNMKVVPWGRPGKPTHFLSLRINNSRNAFSNYQKILKMKHPWASRFLIPPIKFHITLGVLDLSRPGTMKAAVEVVKNLKTALDYEQPLKLAFQGVSQFGNCVLHVKVQDDSIIRDLATKIHAELKEKMLVSGRFAEFDPHVTLLKVRKPQQDNKTSALVNECAQGKEKDLFFGEEEFVQIDLNAMEEVDDDGYYKTIASVVFVQ